MVKRFAKLSVVGAMTVFGLVATAKKTYPDFERLLKISESDTAKLVYRFTGEPVGRPSSLMLYVKCGKDKTWRALGTYLMCDLNKYDFDKETKKLSLQYTDGRVDQQTGESVCDQFGEAEFSFADVCKGK